MPRTEYFTIAPARREEPWRDDMIDPHAHQWENGATRRGSNQLGPSSSPATGTTLALGPDSLKQRP
jgi:hypothetical protein